MLSDPERKILFDLHGQVIALQFMLGTAVSHIGKNSSNGAELLRDIVVAFAAFEQLRSTPAGSIPEGTEMLKSATRCIQGVSDQLFANATVLDRGGDDLA